MDDETRQILNDLGYYSFGGEMTWYCGPKKFIWQRVKDGKWVAGLNDDYAWASPHFDSPINAAAWLNVEAA
uniref:Uncharacterized protein n=1 Tax=viral metagenome TaxID=1070528 RepID=A0A6M3M382_9ZZZZ